MPNQSNFVLVACMFAVTRLNHFFSVHVCIIIIHVQQSNRYYGMAGMTQGRKPIQRNQDELGKQGQKLKNVCVLQQNSNFVKSICYGEEGKRQVVVS